MEKVIVNVEQVTAEWLTAALGSSRALAEGQVADFSLDTGRGNWSSSARIQVTYSEDAQGDLPEKLFLKMVNTDLDDEFFGPSEVHYYTRDYVDVPNAPLLRCYSGVFSPTLQRYHLLLDDVTETHEEASGREPTLAYGLALADGLAALHARWWGGRRLAEAGAPIHSADHIQRFVDIAAPGVGHIMGRFAEELAPYRPETMTELFARHPQALIARTGDDDGFTLIHGDVGEYNVLVPRVGDRPVYIIDRQPFDWSLTTWLGVYDLAYALVLDWPVALRRELERPVLVRYHQQLMQRGVKGYSWERLFDDYRLCVAMGVYIAVEYCRGRVNERWLSIWMPMLKRSLTAIHDLNCAEMW